MKSFILSVGSLATTMKFTFIFVGVFLLNSIQCHDSGSFELSNNGIELSPFYDTIIFSDIADIMKEFETNSLPSLDKLAKEESESGEDIEDLLQEYQNYLEKENKQRKDYIERTKTKNKIPLLRHERFTKNNFGNSGKYNDYVFKNGYYNMYKSKNPLDLFVPISSKVNHVNIMELTTSSPRDSMELNTYQKILHSEGSRLPTTFPKFPMKPPCCKNGQMFCNQCMTTTDYSRSRLEPRINLFSHEKKLNSENKFSELTDPEDALNIRIKIDVQLPKLHEQFDKHQTAFDIDNGGNAKDFPLALKMPSSYFNFPIPMNLFGYKKVSKISSSPLHKITIHKKKKSKSSTGGKKHKKKIITFHNIKLEPQQIYEAHFGTPNHSEVSKLTDENVSTTELVSSTTDMSDTDFSSTTTNPVTNVTQTEENIFLLVNISNNVVNDTEESNKTNNSIETDYTHAISKTTTDNMFHLINKREALIVNETVKVKETVTVNETTTLPTAANITKPVGIILDTINKTMSHESDHKNITKNLKHSGKKVDKGLSNEDELLYWPNNNGSLSKIVSKNITTIILESETKKAKLNLTKETMGHNHKGVLEKAIFGDVDWNDMNAVAPAFMSFIGKYITGTLTFCSDKVCHSMKCGQKVCHHRVCAPEDRFKKIGHCIGANNTDSEATMESIMDLPSNVAFEIVDILQDKMEDKLFGKATLCISSKCITFAVSRKMFIKNKCIIKELNPKGHCLNTKEGKLA